VAVCPEAVAIDASETSNIDRVLADIVEDLIRREVVEPASDLQIPNLESLIAARAGFPNPEQQSCRQIFR